MSRIMSFGAALGIVLAGAAGRAEATEYIFTTIDYPGAVETEAHGINDAGQIVGHYDDAEDIRHAFMLNGGVYTSFDPPSVVQSGSGATGINSLGQIVGGYDAGARIRGFLRTGDEYIDLVADASALTTEPQGINDLGQVVGNYRDAGGLDHGFLFDGTNYTTLNDTNAVNTYAGDINNAGSIVGSGWESSGLPHAFIRDADGTYTDFQFASMPTGGGGINDSGQIVGAYVPAAATDRQGFVLTGDIGSTPDTLIVPGATFSEAYDINNRGQVVGLYSIDGYLRHGFLATPIAAADFDQDGDVDGADLALWQGDYGVSAGCDCDGDGDTDGADFLAWQRQVGNGPAALVAGRSSDLGAVPEPGGHLLALIGLALALPRCRRRNGV